jgi:hypothetical protein
MKSYIVWDNMLYLQAEHETNFMPLSCLACSSTLKMKEKCYVVHTYIYQNCYINI